VGDFLIDCLILFSKNPKMWIKNFVNYPRLPR